MISLAGHTKGSVGLLLAGEGFFLAGDGLNQTLLLLGAEAAPLSQLTEGIHLHTVACPSQEAYDRVRESLSKLGFLLEEK